MIPGLCSLFYRVGTGSGGGFSATASPTSTNTSGRGLRISVAITAHPIGGTAPYTYAWAITGDPSINITSPAASSTTTSATLAAGDNLVGYLQCTITDSAARTATTNLVTITFRYV